MRLLAVLALSGSTPNLDSRKRYWGLSNGGRGEGDGGRDDYHTVLNIALLLLVSRPSLYGRILPLLCLCYKTR